MSVVESRKLAIAHARAVFEQTEGPTPLFDALVAARHDALRLRDALEGVLSSCPTDLNATRRFQEATDQAQAVLADVLL